MESYVILQGVEKAKLMAEFRQIVEQAVKSATPPPPPVAEPDRFITKKEVAAIFGVSEVSVWDWEKKGLLTGYRIGNLVRYKYSEVMASPKMIQRGGQKQ